MSYILIENNKFYGKEGYVISDRLYNKLPKNHKKLFQKKTTNKESLKSDSLSDNYATIKNEFVEKYIDFVQNRRNNHVVENQDELIMNYLMDLDDEDHDDDEEDDDDRHIEPF